MNLQKSLCLGLLALGSVASTPPAKTNHSAARKGLAVDPTFERWLKDDTPPDFDAWPERIAGLLGNIETRLDKLSKNLDILLEHYAADTPENSERWRSCLKSHGFRLEHAFAYLRHRFFIAYTFYLARASSALEQLEQLKPRMATCENGYIGLLARVRESPWGKIIAECGFPEKFPQQGNTVIGTWLEHLRIPSENDPKSVGLDTPPASEALEYLSELLYWREVAAVRKHCFPRLPHDYPEEERGAWVERDTLIVQCIAITEGRVQQLLESIELQAICILTEMIDVYVQSFGRRAADLEYGKEAQEMVTEIPFLKVELLYGMIRAEISHACGISNLTLERFLRDLKTSFATVTVSLFIMLHGRSSDKKANRKPRATRDILEDLKQLDATLIMLRGNSLSMRLFRLPDHPRANLQNIWAMAKHEKELNGHNSSMGMDDDLLRENIEALGLFEQFGSSLENCSWPQPTTFRETVELALEVLLALQQSIRAKQATLTDDSVSALWNKCVRSLHSANMAQDIDTSQLHRSLSVPAPRPTAPTNRKRRPRGNGQLSHGPTRRL